MPHVKFPSLGRKARPPSGEIDVDVDAPNVSVEGPDVDVEGPEVKGKMKSPKFKGPDFHMPHVKFPSLGRKARPPSGEIDVDVDAPNVSVEGPDVEGPEVKGKMKSPKFKGPDFHMPHVKFPSLGRKARPPSGEIDVDVDAPNVSVEGPDVEGPEVKGKMKSPKFKGPDFHMPHMKFPSFGRKARPPSGEIDVDVEGPDARIEGPDVTGPEARGGISGKFTGPKFKGPKFGLEAKGHDLDANIDLPEGEVRGPSADLEGPDVDIQGPHTEGSWKFKGPDFNFKKPKFGFSSKSPELNGEGDLPEAHVKGPDVNINGTGELEGPHAKGGLSGRFDAPKFKGPSFGFSSKRPKGDLESPDAELSGPDAPDVDVEGSRGGIHIPRFRFGAKKPSTDADVDVAVGEVHAPDAEINSPDWRTDVDAPEVKGRASGRFGKVKGFKGPKFGGLKVSGKGGDVDTDVDYPEGSSPNADFEGSDVRVRGPKAKGGFSYRIRTLKDELKDAAQAVKEGLTGVSDEIKGGGRTEGWYGGTLSGNLQSPEGDASAARPLAIPDVSGEGSVKTYRRPEASLSAPDASAEGAAEGYSTSVTIKSSPSRFRSSKHLTVGGQDTKTTYVSTITKTTKTVLVDVEAQGKAAEEGASDLLADIQGTLAAGSDSKVSASASSEGVDVRLKGPE
uniref:Uncharacterized protein n=1 Tax=Branchiostoma floridae TaxID=7739 RepID=C3YDK4_BRAFL|eukprot:XP_002605805.1 hypothetical protein BRAFLDRAFT_123848 [Branchiostoma floridae]